MATSPETFKQVRDILKKLDRSIDSARDRRLSQSDEEASPTNGRVDHSRPPRAKPMRNPTPSSAWPHTAP